MESTDAFAQDTANDPFAADDFGDWTADGAAEPSSELPVVDKEGNTLPNATVTVHPADGSPPRTVPGTVEQTAPAAAPAPPAEQERPTPAPPRVGPTPEAKAAMDAIRPNHQPADGASAETQDAPAAPPAPQAPQAAPAPVEVAKEAVQPAQDAPDAPEPVPAAEKVATALAPEDAPQEAAQEPEADDEPEAEMPEEPKDAKTGRVTHRRYCILRADGPDKFAKLSWYEDKKRNLVEKGTPGARKQSIRLARTTEEALRFGFAVLGGPQDGATLVAVAALYFQPRKVAPAPVQPTRQRLKIS